MRSSGAAASFLLLAALASAATARAADISDTDRQIAQSLFDEARGLLESGRIAEACPKFAESQRLDPGGGTLLNLALCLEMEGRSGSAWARYQEALALAVRDNRKDREEFARTHLAGLAPKLVRVTVVVPPSIAAADPNVQLDGSRLSREAWGTAIAVDPGTHLITSQVGNGARWETNVSAMNAGETVRVEVGSTSSPGRAEPRDKGAPETPSNKRRSTTFWVTLGAGVAAVAAGTVLGFTALDANTKAEEGCLASRGFCTPEGRDAATRATTHAWLSTGFMAGGAVAIGVAWLLPMDPLR